MSKILTVEKRAGEIISQIRKKRLVETPEERVRQEYLCALVNEYGYSIDQIDEEQSVTGKGSGDARADCPSEYGLSNGVASSEFLTIKPRENILKDFLAHYLRSTAVEIQARQAIGARMPRISSESLLSFIIPLPPLNIQQNILDKVKETQVQVMKQIEIVDKKSREIKAEIDALILGTKEIV